MDRRVACATAHCMLQYRPPHRTTHAFRGLRTSLRAAFERAMPAGDWTGALSHRACVGMFDLRDWWTWVSDAHALLDADESRRVLGRRAPAHRDDLALAYALHRLLLGQALGCDAGQVPLGRDHAGCPRVRGGAWFTSLSHADGCVAVAISGAGPVGVDLEPSTRAAVMLEIETRTCHPAETAAMATLDRLARSEALLATWVRKEAFLKATGLGLQREMTSFTADDGARLDLPDGNICQVSMLDVGPYWVAAVAAPCDIAIDALWLRPAVGDAAGPF